MSIDLTTAQREGYVVGLKSESGVFPRREIDDLMVNDPDCFNLYILALERIMKDEGGKQDKMNYFQIAGIHGLPLTNWDGVAIPGAREAGSYCNHGSFLFPSWHRPYLAMMEQTLYSAMKDIASKFNDPKYKDAAKRFRLPFWDWIKPRDQRPTPFPGVGRDGSKQVGFSWNFDLPAVLQLPTLRVYRPESQKKLVDISNPLTKYTFPKVGSLPDSAWSDLEAGDDDENADRRREAARTGRSLPPMVHASRKRTVRNPTSDFGEQDNLGRVNQSLNMMRESSVENALNLILLKDYNNYLDFAAEAPRRQRDGRRIGPAGSLEDIHNRYHGITGGDGHMGRVPVAAFDPVFWLHHCNIDRILTIWQAVHSGSDAYLPPGEGDFGRDLPLWPFRKDGKKSFWNSADVQDHKVFGYTYADVSVVSRTGSATDRPVKEIRDRWFQSYVWSVQRDPRTQPPEWMMPPSVRDAQVFKAAETIVDTGSAMASMTTLSTVLSQKAHSVAQAVVGTASVEGVGPVPEVEKAVVVPIPQPNAPGVLLLDSQAPQVKTLLQEDAKAEPTIQWYVDVEVQRDAFNGAFTIFYFIGSAAEMATIDEDPSAWQVAHILAGTTHVFTAPRQACDACNLHAERGTIVTGTSPITPMLSDYVLNAGKLEGLAPEQVVPFLKKNLYWRVKAINNIPVDPEEMPFMKVLVNSVMAAQRLDEGVPVNSQAEEYPEVTEGRRGGNPVA